MNRQEAKEMLPIIQAFAKGRPIEYQDSYEKWVESDIMAFDLSPENYRIKREPKYRPFANAEECWQEMKKHQPFGWLKHKTDNVYSFISMIDKDCCYFAVNVYWGFDTLFKTKTFIDGAPFGIKEE
ncbi:hypothetical protein I6E38_09090 [Prevotella stercorea]|uniref:hypothetical protein n=1 Tax=Leyella stercorea TaxID=363265 RepID=UPI001F240F38|nr:hypothetical protein [Leyella stercorea]MCF2579261.1 hypothetical protein [Leyella stercorea]